MAPRNSIAQKRARRFRIHPCPSPSDVCHLLGEFSPQVGGCAGAFHRRHARWKRLAIEKPSAEGSGARAGGRSDSAVFLKRCPSDAHRRRCCPPLAHPVLESRRSPAQEGPGPWGLAEAIPDPANRTRPIPHAAFPPGRPGSHPKPGGKTGGSMRHCRSTWIKSTTNAAYFVCSGPRVAGGNHRGQRACGGMDEASFAAPPPIHLTAPRRNPRSAAPRRAGREARRRSWSAPTAGPTGWRR